MTPKELERIGHCASRLAGNLPNGPMGPAEFKFLAGVSQQKLAAECGLTVKTVNSWATGRRPIPPIWALAFRLRARYPMVWKSLAPVLTETR